MKRPHPLLLLSLFLIPIIHGCTSTIFYQLYSTDSNNAIERDGGIVFKNEDIEVIYNFWDNYGSTNFILYNKSDSDIFIDLKASHLIINSLARTYFQDREFTESSSTSIISGSYYSLRDLNSYSSALGSAFNSQGYSTATVATSSSSTTLKNAQGYSVSYKEKDVVCVPSKTGKVFIGFGINSSLYRDCDLYRFPSKKQIQSKNFQEETSPLIMRNIISYGYNRNDIANKIESTWWVSEITNYSKGEFIEDRNPKFCDEESSYGKKYFVYSKPNRFFIEYNKQETEDLIH